MRFCVHMPVWGRLELLEIVLQNLQRVAAHIYPHELKVCIAGSEEGESRRVAEKYDAAYVEVPNTPLGAKVNSAVQLCADYDPDGIVGLGSDDLVNAAMFRHWAKHLGKGMDFIGVTDLYCLDLKEREAVYWPGYTNHRRGETIGPGRCHSPWLMDLLDWQPFGAENTCNLDWSMMQKLRGREYKTATFRMDEISACVVDVKCGQGINSMPEGELVPRPVGMLRRYYGDDVTEALLRL